MAYVDGFVLAVKKADKDKYIEHARKAAAIFKELGATRCVECWGDDVPRGKVTDFYGAVKAEDDEVVLFSWLEYPSKEIRDEAVKKMMTDERVAQMEMPFDGKRMIVGGFAKVVDE